MARYEIATEPRGKPKRIKESIVGFRGYLNKELGAESVAEFSDQPNKCGRSYRLVVVRKNSSVQKGETVLLEDIKYFFYITNHTAYCAEKIVALANGRCDQENVIEQLKNGVNAMRMPVDDLLSNWAYMVMSALAWNLKAWYGLLMPNRERGLELFRMEFRRFLHLIVLLPAYEGFHHQGETAAFAGPRHLYLMDSVGATPSPRHPGHQFAAVHRKSSYAASVFRWCRELHTKLCTPGTGNVPLARARVAIPSVWVLLQSGIRPLAIADPIPVLR